MASLSGRALTTLLDRGLIPITSIKALVRLPRWVFAADRGIVGHDETKDGEDMKLRFLIDSSDRLLEHGIADILVREFRSFGTIAIVADGLSLFDEGS